MANAIRQATRSTPYKVGFIGLGAMGYPMARNLRQKLRPEDQFIVHDVNRSAITQFVQEVGSENSALAVSIADSAGEVAEKADTVITCLPEPSHVRSVFDAILDSRPPAAGKQGAGRLYIDCSTIDPITSSSIAKSIRDSYPEDTFVDAPMSGGVVGAKAGTLTFMVGAAESVMDRTEAILVLMGKRIVRTGEQGSGLTAKLANNYLMALNNVATCEALNMGSKLGLDAKVLAQIINTSSGRSWISEINNPVPGVSEGAPAERDYQGGFGIKMMKKDLRLAIAAADEVGASTTLGKHVQTLYDRAEQAEGNRDFSVVYRVLQNNLKES